MCLQILRVIAIKLRLVNLKCKKKLKIYFGRCAEPEYC
jgi:hypothetical protein